jgi:cation:H+ antiporter
MFAEIILLIGSLLLILAAAEGFTNGIEVFGKRFSFSQAVAGNLIAAIGTALPETVLPLVAIFWSGTKNKSDIGVGAILGAPFMLSSLAFLISGLTVLISCLMKRRKFEIRVEPHSVIRDMSFFIPMYTVGVFMPLLISKALAIPISILLVGGYVVYAVMTAKSESGEITFVEGLRLWRLIKRLGFVKTDHPHTIFIAMQVAGSLCLMVLGARGFVNNLGDLAVQWGMSPLLFALMLAPVATELPEKFNSVMWLMKGKDALAIGNISGAMVFQSAFPVTIGILFTEWQIAGLAIFSAIIAILSASLLLVSLLVRKTISPFVLLAGGAFYAIYIMALLIWR